MKVSGLFGYKLEIKRKLLLNLQVCIGGLTHPEDVRCCAFVGGFQSDESDAVVQRRVAQHARPEDGVLRDVARRVDARKNVRQTLLDRLGVPVPRQLLRAGLLHVTLRGHREKHAGLNLGSNPTGRRGNVAGSAAFIFCTEK